MKKYLITLLAAVMIVALMLAACTPTEIADNGFLKFEKANMSFQKAVADIANSVPVEQEESAPSTDKQNMSVVSGEAMTDIVSQLQKLGMSPTRYSQTVGIWKDTVPNTVLDMQIAPLSYAKLGSITGIEFLTTPFNVRNDACYSITEEEDGYSVTTTTDLEDTLTSYVRCTYSSYSGTTAQDVAFTQAEVYLNDSNGINSFTFTGYADGQYLSFRLDCGETGDVMSDLSDMVVNCRIEISFLDSMETYQAILDPYYSDKANGESSVLPVIDYDSGKSVVLQNARKLLQLLNITADGVVQDIDYMKQNYIDAYSVWEDSGEFSKVKQYVDEYRQNFYENFDLQPVVEEFYVENGVLKEYLGKSDIVTIPDDVTVISEECNISGKTLVIPSGLQEIRGTSENLGWANIYGFENVIIEDNDNFYVDGAIVRDKDGNNLFLLINGQLETVDYSQVTPRYIMIYTGYHKQAYAENEGDSLPSVKEVVIDTATYNDSSTPLPKFPNIEKLTFVASVNTEKIDIDGTLFGDKLKEIILPDNLRSVEFNRLPDGVSYNIPSELEEITIDTESSVCPEIPYFEGKLTLYGQNISELTVPYGITDIICECPSLISVTIPDSVKYNHFTSSVIEKVVYTGNRETLPQLGLGSEGNLLPLREVVLPTGITEIPDNQFAFTSIESLQLPSTVTRIGNGAFNGCERLAVINFPEGISYVGDFAFRNTALTEIEFTEGNVSLGLNAFQECSLLQTVKLLCDSATLSTSTFEGCTALQSAYLNGVSTVAGSAFYGCTSLEQVVFSDKIREIGLFAFYGCTSLASLQLPEGLTAIEDNAFRYTAVTSLTVPSTVTSFGNLLCADTMEEIEILPSDNEITFALGCGEGITAHVNNITLPANVTEIYLYDYEDENLSIGSLTVYGRPDVMYVEIASTLNLKDIYSTEWESYIEETRSFVQNATLVWKQAENYFDVIYLNDDGSIVRTESVLEGTLYAVTGEAVSASDDENSTSEFVGWKDINGQFVESIIIRDNLNLYASYNTVKTFRTEDFGDGVKVTGYTLTDYNPLKIVVPETVDGKPVVAIERGAFAQCTDVTELTVPFVGASEGGMLTDLFGDTLPQNLKKVVVTNSSVAGGFANSNVETVTYSQPLTAIADGAFSGCMQLTTLNADMSAVESIGFSAFAYCAIEQLELPVSVRYIAETAFEQFGGNVVYDGTVGDWLNIRFASRTSNPFANSGNYVFEGQPLTVIDIPQGFTAVGAFAFVNAVAVKEIIIPDSVTEIGESAFYGCTSVGKMTVSTNIFGNVSALGRLFAPEGLPDWTTDYNSKYLPKTLTELTVTGNSAISGSALASAGYITRLEIGDGVTAIYGLSGMASLEYVRLPYIGKDAQTNGHISDVMDASTLASLAEIVVGNGTSHLDFNSLTGWTGGNKTLRIGSGITTITLAGYSTERPGNLYYQGTLKQWFGIAMSCNDGYPYSAMADSIYIDGTLAEGELTIPDGVTSVGDFAFYRYGRLTSVVIPESVTQIGNCAFQYIETLERVELNAVNCTGYAVFMKESVSPIDVVIGENVERIADGFFANISVRTLQFEANGSCAYIGNDNFNSLQAESLQLPDSVTAIGSNAFTNSQFYTLTLPSNLLSVGDNAFTYCYNITELYLPQSVQTLGEGAFSQCWNVTKAQIPATTLETFQSLSLTDLYVFNGEISTLDMYSLKNLYLMEGVTFSPSETYISVYQLEKLYINTDLQNVSQSVILSFLANGNVDVTIGDKVNAIPDRLFENVILKSLTFQENSTCEYIGEYAFSNSNLTSVAIPDSVLSVGQYAFNYCTQLQEVTLPHGLKSIAEGMFAYCYELQLLTMPDSVTDIGAYSFTNTALVQIQLPDSTVSIGDNAFNASRLTEITLPDGIEYIGSGAFGNCGLTEIVLPDGITEVSDALLSNCSNLVSVTMSDNVTAIGNSAFSNCTSLADITLPATVTKIGDYAFSGCFALTIVINAETEYVGYWAFDHACKTVYCEAAAKPSGWDNSWGNGANVVWGYNNVTSNQLYDYVVRGDCAVLTKYKGTDRDVVIPQQVDGLSVTRLGDIFYGSADVSLVTVPQSVTYLAQNAFAECPSLFGVFLSQSVERAGSRLVYGTEAEIYCESSTVPEGWATDWSDGAEATYMSCSNVVNPNYYSYILYGNNALLTALESESGEGKYYMPDEFDGHTIVSVGVTFTGNKLVSHVSLPHNLTIIEDYAFYGCENIQSIDFYDGILSVGNHAFEDCVALEQVKFGSGLTEVGEYAFSGCSMLTEVRLPFEVRVIEDYAFESCTSLQTLVLGGDLEYIYYGAFEGCNSLSEVYFQCSEEQWNNVDVFPSNYYLQEVSNRYWYSETQPESEGNFWYYEDGNIRYW